MAKRKPEPMPVEVAESKLSAMVGQTVELRDGDNYTGTLATCTPLRAGCGFVIAERDYIFRSNEIWKIEDAVIFTVDSWYTN